MLKRSFLGMLSFGGNNLDFGLSCFQKPQEHLDGNPLAFFSLVFPFYPPENMFSGGSKGNNGKKCLMSGLSKRYVLK